MPDNLAQLPLTLCLFKATVAAGSTTTMSNTGSIHYIIRNKLYLKTVMSNVATPTTDIVTGLAFRPISANQVTVIVLMLDTGGNLKAAQGSIEAYNGAMGQAPQFPSVPDTCCPIAYMLCKGGSTLVGTWTFGTNNNSSVTGMTWVIVDIANIPDRPQIS